MSRYAVSDLHGRLDLWNQISNYCKPDDEIYFLGDAIDRGPDSIELMLKLIKDKRVIYLLGNHEVNFYMWIKHFLGEERNDRIYELNVLNGGEKTMSDFASLSLLEQGIIKGFLASASYKMLITNDQKKKIYLSHSGAHPDYNETEILYLCQKGFIPWLCDTTHIQVPWPDPDYPNTYIIHGHMPVQNLYLYDISLTICRPQVMHYAGGHKVDIDLGSWKTGISALFNLDTFQVEGYFMGEGTWQKGVSD